MYRKHTYSRVLAPPSDVLFLSPSKHWEGLTKKSAANRGLNLLCPCEGNIPLFLLAGYQCVYYCHWNLRPLWVVFNFLKILVTKGEMLLISIVLNFTYIMHAFNSVHYWNVWISSRGWRKYQSINLMDWVYTGRRMKKCEWLALMQRSYNVLHSLNIVRLS